MELTPLAIKCSIGLEWARPTEFAPWFDLNQKPIFWTLQIDLLAIERCSLHCPLKAFKRYTVKVSGLHIRQDAPKRYSGHDQGWNWPCTRFGICSFNFRASFSTQRQLKGMGCLPWWELEVLEQRWEKIFDPSGQFSGQHAWDPNSHQSLQSHHHSIMTDSLSRGFIDQCEPNWNQDSAHLLQHPSVQFDWADEFPPDSTQFLRPWCFL